MELVKLVIAWTCVGVFVATALITLLALVKVIELAGKKYLDRLFKILIVEIVGVCVAFFGMDVSSTGTVEQEIIERGRVEAVREMRTELAAVTATLGNVRAGRQLTDTERQHLDRQLTEFAGKLELMAAPPPRRD